MERPTFIYLLKLSSYENNCNLELTEFPRSISVRNEEKLPMEKYISPHPAMEEYLSKKSIPGYWEPKLQVREGIVEDELHLLEF